MSMTRTLTRWLFPLAALGLVLATSARSDAAPGEDPEAARIRDTGHSLKWNWTPPGRTDRFGHAEVLINAPLASVRSVITDFGHYKDLVPEKFHNARVIAKENGTTDLYMQVPIMHGVVTLWDVLRFGPVRTIGPNTEQLEGRYVKGNIKDANIVLTIRSIEPNWTLLKFDLLLLPNIPAPQSAIDEELRDAARQGVDAIHDRAQGTQQWFTWNPQPVTPPPAAPAPTTASND
jgi:hypothetical protein